ncbi:hypothetical protein JOM56_000340 [Amanita muscaria]
MKPSSDVFRPKLPSDPFVDLDVDQPWHIALNNADAQLASPRVILVFGAPSQADLRSLLTSQWLSDSLLLIATHTPPSWNGQPVPTVRILRLASSLEEGGGRELASLFDRAERLAHQYRSKRLPFPDKKFAQLAEKFPGGDFTVLEDYTAGHVAGANRNSSPTLTNPSKLKRMSVISSASSNLRGKPKEAPSTVSSQQRTLDGILHFIPASLSEKEIYKRAILVTTLSVSFLSAPLSHQLSPHADPPKRRFSPLLRSKNRQSLFLPYDSVATEPQAVYRPHLVLVLPKSSPTPASSRSTSSSSGSSTRPPFLARHPSPSSTSKPSSSAKLNHSSAFYIPPLDSDPSNPHPRSHRLPISAPIHSKGVTQRQGSFSSTTSTSGRKRLAQSVEQFLIQFAYPAPSSPDDGRSVPYLLSPDVFSRAVCMQGDGDVVPNNELEALASEGRLSVGEAILLGLLDAPAKGDDVSSAPKSLGRLATRAWIAENQQVALVQTSTGLKTRDDSLAPSLPPSSVSAPAPTHRPSGKEKEWDSVVMRDETFFEGPIMNAILSPNPYPSFQNTPLPWSSFGAGPQPDEATIEKPAPIIPRMHIPLSPPMSTVNDLDSKRAIKSDDSDSAPIEATLPSLRKLAAETEPSAADTDATESVSSHLAKTASTDHSRPGAPGLLTPPESSSSSDSCGASEYESCEMFSVTEHGATPVKMVANERGPGPFVLFHPTSPERRSKGERDEAAKEPEGLSLTGRIGHRFRRLTKVMSLSTTAASSMSRMALSTGSPKRRVTRRERTVVV